MSDLNKLIKQNIKNLFEDKPFKEMESAFGVNKELSEKEKAQFEDMEETGVESNGSVMKQEKVPGTTIVNKTRKEAGKESIDYYKETAKKMKKYQTPDEKEQKPSQIGEALEDTPKVDREMSDEEAYETEVYGSGMQGLKYDDEGSAKEKMLQDRMDDLHDGDPTYKKLKDTGKKFRDYKYNKPDEYKNSPKVRVENKDMKYTDVKTENIFKANGKLVSEEQVLKLANKVPSRVKIDESVFAITDGENYYRILWEGEEPIITHSKNENVMTENIDSMKKMWSFDTSDSISTKKNITENGDEAFKRMFNQLRDKDGLIG